MIAATDKSVTELIGRYLKEIEKLKARLIESEQMYQQLKKSAAQAARVKNVLPFGDTDGLYGCNINQFHIGLNSSFFFILWGRC